MAKRRSSRRSTVKTTGKRWVRSKKTGRMYRTYKVGSKMVLEYKNGQKISFKIGVNRTEAQKTAKRKAAGKKGYKKVKSVLKKHQFKKGRATTKKRGAKKTATKITIPKGKTKGQKFTKNGVQYVVGVRKTAAGGYKRYARKV